MCQNTCVLSVKIHNNKSPDLEALVLSRRNEHFWQKCSFYEVKPGGARSMVLNNNIYIDIIRFNNCPPGPFRFLQRRVSLRIQFPPPLRGGKSIFTSHFVPPQSQSSRPLTLRHLTFVECGLPLQSLDARNYFLASSASQKLGGQSGWAACLAKAARAVLPPLATSKTLHPRHGD